MIDYSPFWKTLEDSKENWYTLTKHHHVSDSTLHRLKHNKDISIRQNQRECQEVLFETRGDVEKILDTLNYCISKYGCVTLADFYDLAGVRALYEDCKFGWTTLNGVKVVRKRDGYTIEFPRAMPVT